MYEKIFTLDNFLLFHDIITTQEYYFLNNARNIHDTASSVRKFRESHHIHVVHMNKA